LVLAGHIIFEKERPITMKNFLDLGLPADLLRALEKMQFTTPTPIQEQAIPVALDGNDVLGSAQTGTGKTGAFGIPLVAHLIKNPESAAIIMAPTRELATQVLQTIKKLISQNPAIKTALLIGGENMFRQFRQLEDHPRIIVGTPGRINDHLTRKSLRLGNADFLVLDEMDRMLDMGFGVQIDKVLAFMPQERQTLMFSATMPKHIINMSEKYMKNAVRIAVGSTTAPSAAIKQNIIRVSQPEKYTVLTQQLDARGGSVIIFVRTKHGADRLAHKLEKENHEAAAIHGDLRQNQRDKVIRKFREKSIRILVATDVAARGLDVPHIEHVINYDLPQCPEDYIHRIGRTARAGAQGEALSMISPDENGKWIAIEKLMNKSGSPAPADTQKPEKTHRARPYKDNAGRGDKKYAPQWQKKKPFRKGPSSGPSSRPVESSEAEAKKAEDRKFSGKKFEKKKPNGPQKFEHGKKKKWPERQGQSQHRGDQPMKRRNEMK
jgi:ATP-dependent RNA helicase DeaD